MYHSMIYSPIRSLESSLIHHQSLDLMGFRREAAQEEIIAFLSQSYQ